ncbi:hypothetical protein [Psychrobacter frigidicola]|uniref:hypothetical protein n=1 Tax=Psychrobacter frigidicola TaxID=45611 RepID=UPI00191909CB|nr:hypothetical protein [Psychrobacter frigidicola]
MRLTQPALKILKVEYAADNVKASGLDNSMSSNADNDKNNEKSGVNKARNKKFFTQKDVAIVRLK